MPNYNYSIISTTVPGAPTTGTWATGQQITDSSGVQWICSSGGTPGTWGQSAAYAPVLGGAAPIAGPPTAAGTITGQDFIDANGVVWVWNGSQWVMGGAGVELGVAKMASAYTLTTSIAAVPGLSLPVNVPAGLAVFVECECPWVGMGSTAAFVVLRIFEDTVQLKTALLNIAANQNAPLRVSETYTPLTAGPHTYSAQADISTTSAGAAINGGNFGGSVISPHLRVVTA